VKITNIQKFLERIPSSIYLALAVLIFASSNSVTRKIVAIGKQNLIDGRNPISLCNVLFVGNICAFGLMALIFHQDWKIKNLKAISLKNCNYSGLNFNNIFQEVIKEEVGFDE